MESASAAKASEFGADLIGFVQLDGMCGREWAQAFIILGIPLMLPIVETCPSIWGLEHEKTVKILLNKAANRVCALFNAEGHRTESVVMNLSELANVGRRAGLGSIGENGRLLTRKYGPRVITTSLATDMKLCGKKPFGGELCLKCGNCRRACPVGAKKAGDPICTAYEAELATNFKNPCGACLRSCPIGEDRRLYDSVDVQKYFENGEYMSEDTRDKTYKAWAHIRGYGSYPHAEINSKHEEPQKKGDKR
jgi:epoxyqueuosine reductase QueG